MTVMDKEQARGLERHAQTVIVLILTALLLWVGTTTQDMSVAIAKLEVEMKYLRETPHPVDVNQLTQIESRLQAIEIQLAGLTASTSGDNP